MKARFNRDGGITMLWGKPEELLQVMQGLKGNQQAQKPQYVPYNTKPLTSWETVLGHCRKGIAKSLYGIGDVLSTYHTTLGRIDWRICSMTDKQLCLLATRPVIAMQFDAGEKAESENGEKNPDSMRKYGYNRWEASAVRQWLNNSAPAGFWWKPQNDWDVEPEAHKKVDGFLAGFDDDFLRCVMESKVVTADENGGKSYKTLDKFFLPSITEVHGENNCGVQEGHKWELGDDLLKGFVWWLRSPSCGDANDASHTYSTGSLDCNSASITYGVAPACVIG